MSEPGRTRAPRPRGDKVRMGVSFDPEIMAALDARSKTFQELGVTRSEVVNAILADFLDSDASDEAVWEAVSKRRIKKRIE
ncbi:MAG: hypothetical protein JRN11_05490 [Nitrososphaerota archaeon]|nr:hypothetical protein [Nitrososphaerota archaeon]MDG7026184.1 hypothetical protein [Nitrososphaerota archaeon]